MSRTVLALTTPVTPSLGTREQTDNEASDVISSTPSCVVRRRGLSNLRAQLERQTAVGPSDRRAQQAGSEDFALRMGHPHVRGTKLSF